MRKILTVASAIVLSASMTAAAADNDWLNVLGELLKKRSDRISALLPEVEPGRGKSEATFQADQQYCQLHAKAWSQSASNYQPLYDKCMQDRGNRVFPRGVMPGPGKNPVRFQVDQQYCQISSNNTGTDNESRRRLYRRCMEAKGHRVPRYALVPIDPDGDWDSDYGDWDDDY